VKTDVEELSPTRVKLTIEVPFEELKPSLDKAYREIAKHVRLKGFRPGKAPAPLIDRYVGRDRVLQEAVNDALPELYGRAVQENEVFPLGTPDVDISKLDDDTELVFTAEVDIRPKFQVPDYDGLSVKVDDGTVTPDQVEEALGALRERFSTLRNADRPAATGDYVSIDVAASVDGESIEDARTSGYSYEVGSGTALEGLDDTLVGMSAGDTATFTSTLVGGDHAGEEAEVTVTVHSVKVKDLPEMNDEFAQLASEFDTIGELRADTRRRLERGGRVQQFNQARDRALDALLEKIDIPLPESAVQSEIERRTEQLNSQLEMIGMTKEQYLSAQGKAASEFDAEIEEGARHGVKGGFVLDQLARQEELQAKNEELTDYVVQQAIQMGVPPDQLAQRLTETGQLPALVTDVLRNKALALLVEHVKVTDESGKEVDIKAIQREADAERPGADLDLEDLDLELEDAEDEDAEDETEEDTGEEAGEPGEGSGDAGETVGDTGAKASAKTSGKTSGKSAGKTARKPADTGGKRRR
jgi:trigger factor